MWVDQLRVGDEEDMMRPGMRRLFSVSSEAYTQQFSLRLPMIPTVAIYIV